MPKSPSQAQQKAWASYEARGNRPREAVTTRFSDDEIAALDAARKEGESRAAVVRRAVAHYLAHWMG